MCVWTHACVHVAHVYMYAIACVHVWQQKEISKHLVLFMAMDSIGFKFPINIGFPMLQEDLRIRSVLIHIHLI